MSTKQNFIKALLKGSSFTILPNAVGLCKLDSGATAKIEIKYSKVQDYYNNLTLTISDVNKGTIDITSFRFNELLEQDPNNNHPNANKDGDIVVISRIKWEWYIDTPTKSSVKSLVEAIEDYLSFY